ncbi:tRNA (guanine-N1)-methyltransferase [Candidatus Woesearchaeota archaeon]|nr:tRNA (guanine-N1)-methyltransferase [Candidatus Woesearchaeota archaeon]
MRFLKEALKKKLSKKELNELKTSFDIIGDIAVIEISETLEKKEKLIANTLLNLVKNIKTVFKKSGGHYGRYRRQKLVFLSGEKKTETVHRESNVQIKLDVLKCYFSPRLSHERLRIANQIKKNENVLVMFSGVAPYPLVLAKNSPVNKVFGIEVNPVAHKYAVENVIKNKQENKISLINGDVKKVIPLIKEKFDRIIMPLPKTSEEFLPIAFFVSKPKTLIHYYSFYPEEEIDSAKKNILTICKKSKVSCKILNIVRAGQSAPRIYRYCFDILIINQHRAL